MRVKQSEVLDYWVKYNKKLNKQPTEEVLSEKFGISCDGVKYHMNNLIKKGLIKKAPRKIIQKGEILFKYPKSLAKLIEASMTLNEVRFLTQWFIQAAKEKLEKEGLL